MKLAVHAADLTWPGGAGELAPTLAGVARAADQGGVTTLTMMDHWFQMEQMGGPAEPMLEGYTTLGFLAARVSLDRERLAHDVVTMALDGMRTR